MKLRNKKLLFWLCAAIAGVGTASFIWCIWLTDVMEPFKITMSSVLLLIYIATTSFFYTVLTELWGKDGDAQEVLLTKQNAMRLADTLKMAVVEFTVEEMMERNNQRIAELCGDE